MKSKILTLVVVLAFASVATARKDKLAPELQSATSANNVNVIVRYKVAPEAQHQQRISAHQGQVTKDLRMLQDFAVTIPASQLDDLSNDDDVAYIAPDRQVGAFFFDTPAPAVLAQYAWSQGLDGSNIAVAVIDSGIRGSALVPFKELTTSGTTNSRIVYSQSWITDSWGVNDHFGHGTHVE